MTYKTQKNKNKRHLTFLKKLNEIDADIRGVVTAKNKKDLLDVNEVIEVDVTDIQINYSAAPSPYRMFVAEKKEPAPWVYIVGQLINTIKFDDYKNGK